MLNPLSLLPECAEPFLSFYSLLLLMAEGIVVEGKTLDQLEGKVTCAVCQEFYTEPKILPCLHYYCRVCVLKIAGAGKSFSCPECRSKTTLSEGDVDGLINYNKSFVDFAKIYLVVLQLE